MSTGAGGSGGSGGSEGSPTKYPVFTLEGHGCLTNEMFILPENIVWIELGEVNESTTADLIKKFRKKSVEKFLTTTPIPKTPSEKSDYHGALQAHVGFNAKAKFPGDRVGDGINSLLLDFKNEFKTLFERSGIINFYDTRFRPGYALTLKDEGSVDVEENNFIYEYSLYPTKEFILDKMGRPDPTESYRDRIPELKFSEFVKDISRGGSEYNVRIPENGHVVIIQSACRVACIEGMNISSLPSVSSPAPLRRTNSIEIAQSRNAHLSNMRLLAKNVGGETKLLYYLNHNQYELALHFFELIMGQKKAAEVYNYLILEYNGQTALKLIVNSNNRGLIDLLTTFIVTNIMELDIDNCTDVLASISYTSIDSILEQPGIISRFIDVLASYERLDVESRFCQAVVILCENLSKVRDGIHILETTKLPNMLTKIVETQSVSVDYFEKRLLGFATHFNIKLPYEFVYINPSKRVTYALYSGDMHIKDFMETRGLPSEQHNGSIFRHFLFRGRIVDTRMTFNELFKRIPSEDRILYAAYNQTGGVRQTRKKHHDARKRKSPRMRRP